MDPLEVAMLNASSALAVAIVRVGELKKKIADYTNPAEVPTELVAEYNKAVATRALAEDVLVTATWNLQQQLNSNRDND